MKATLVARTKIRPGSSRDERLQALTQYAETLGFRFTGKRVEPLKDNHHRPNGRSGITIFLKD